MIIQVEKLTRMENYVEVSDDHFGPTIFFNNPTLILQTLTFQLRQEFCSLVVLLGLFYKQNRNLNLSFSLIAIKKGSTISLSDGALP